MTWMKSFEYEGLPFVLQSEAFVGTCGGQVAVLFLRDEATIQAVRSRDERILTLLNYLLDEIDEITLAQWAQDADALDQWYSENGLDAFEELLRRLLRNRHLGEAGRRELEVKLEEAIQEQGRRIEKAAKRHHSQRRRSQFERNYDALMLVLIERDGYRCAVCHTREDLTIDHVIPLSKGGGDESTNLRLLCRKHNSLKADKPGVTLPGVES